MYEKSNISVPTPLTFTYIYVTRRKKHILANLMVCWSQPYFKTEISETKFFLDTLNRTRVHDTPGLMTITYNEIGCVRRSAS